MEVGWHVAELPSVLGEKAFAEARAQGRTMTVSESFDYALEEEADLERA